MLIIVIDGQGGGIGKTLVEKLNKALKNNKAHELIALGTNAIATSAMVKAGAENAATGENAIVYNVKKADVIVGAIGIISANAMLGELTPQMAQAISESKALKVLIPLNRCNLQIVGVMTQNLPKKIDEAVRTVIEYIQ